MLVKNLVKKLIFAIEEAGLERVKGKLFVAGYDGPFRFFNLHTEVLLQLE